MTIASIDAHERPFLTLYSLIVVRLDRTSASQRRKLWRPDISGSRMLCLYPTVPCLLFSES